MKGLTASAITVAGFESRFARQNALSSWRNSAGSSGWTRSSRKFSMAWTITEVSGALSFRAQYALALSLRVRGILSRNVVLSLGPFIGISLRIISQAQLVISFDIFYYLSSSESTGNAAEAGALSSSPFAI